MNREQKVQQTAGCALLIILAGVVASSLLILGFLVWVVATLIEAAVR